MTRYTVVWHASAQDELAALWTAAPDRNAITKAAHLVDVELSQDAATKGVEIAEGLRALVSPPLRILFSVDEEDRLVEVVRVKSLRRVVPLVAAEASRYNELVGAGGSRSIERSEAASRDHFAH